MSSGARRRIQDKIRQSLFCFAFWIIFPPFFFLFFFCFLHLSSVIFHHWSELKSHSRSGSWHLRQMVLTWPVLGSRPDEGAVEAQMMPYWASSCSSKWLKASQGQMTVMSAIKHSKHSDCCTNRTGDTQGSLRETHLCLSPPFLGCHHQIWGWDPKQLGSQMITTNEV